jgi:hypothetical protein
VGIVAGNVIWRLFQDCATPVSCKLVPGALHSKRIVKGVTLLMMMTMVRMRKKMEKRQEGGFVLLKCDWNATQQLD